MVLRVGPRGSAGAALCLWLTRTAGPPSSEKVLFWLDEVEGSATAANLCHKPVGTCGGNGLSHLTKL